MVPLSVIQDDEEHAMHYAQSLPYVDKLEHEAQDWLNDIRSNLVISIQAKDYTGGAVAWTKRLANYLDMKHAISRETRAHLAKIYYEMLVMPGMNYALLELWSNTCVRLIKHKKRLDPEDLTLEWRPLYELIRRSLFPKKRNAFLMAMHPVLRAVGYMQRFFPANATKEILEEFLPHFTTHSPSDAILAEGYLVYFLPVDYKPQRTVQAQDYLPTIYSLWSMYTNSNAFDPQLLCLVSKIAKNQIEHGDNEIGVFSKQQVKSVFTYALRAFNLPVGSRSDGSSSAGGATTGYGSAGSRNDKKLGSAVYLCKRGPTEKFSQLARFMVYTIMPDQENKDTSYALSLLSDFIQATELYFHPSNHGMWSWWLTFFLRYLTSTFLSRWKEEQKEDCATPPHRRLTPGIRREFVLILRSVLYISMFGKDHAVVTLSQGSIKNLAWLEPAIIFPGLLERIYPSLETLTETHRTNSAINILKDIASPLISRENYPAGGKHLLPLLHLSIPGIDMNDPSKTLGSFFFISIALMSVPIIDMSQQQDGYYPTEEFIDDPHAELSRETEDYLVKATTGEFEEWLAKFMRRVFTIFENLPQENRKMQGRSSSNPTIETAITQTLLHACDTIFGQLSDDLYDLVLRMMVEFISDRVLPNAVRVVGLLCEAIAKANPQKAAKAFIPLCIANIQVELEHGAASTVTHAASSNLIQSDSTFHWYQNILFSVIRFLGPELLPYKQDVVSVAHAMIQQCRSRRGIMWTGKLLRNVLSTLLNVYPKDYRSVVPSLWNDKEYMLKHAHQLWGQPGDPANLEIDWHVPSEAEKNFALEFLAEFLAPAMQRLEELIQQNPANNHQVSNEFCRNLAVVRNCLMGSSAMVGDDGMSSSLDQKDAMVVDEDDDDDESIERMPEQHLEVGYAFNDAADPRTEQARTIRRSMGELIHKLSDFFRSHREDDVESVKIWIKIARTFLSERGVEKSVFDNKKQNYSLGKDISKTPHCGKKYARNLLVRRAYNHHLLRLRQNNQSRLRTPLHDAILCDLLELSLGSYAEIRKLSQSALSATSRSFRGSKKLFIPVLLDALKPNVPSDRMKGALYLFSHKSILHPCLRDWSYIPTFIKAICSAQHQDKLTIQELLRDIHDRYIKSFNSFTFKTLTPDSMANYVKPLSPSTTEDPNFSKRVSLVEQRVNARLEKNTAACREVMDFLLDFIQDPQVHWRFSTMSADFIKMLLKCEVSASRRLAEFANRATVSELPDMRDVGLRATTVLLLYIKQRTFAAGNEELLITGKTRNPLKVDMQVQDPEDFGMGRRLLDATYQGLTPENAQESVLIDNMALGWYVWPSHYTGYKVNTNDFLFDTVAAECQEAYDEFQKTFSTSDYWRKMCAYLSEEINPKEDVDRFESIHASLFKSIFQTFGDVPLTCAKEHIEKLCYAADQKNAQRAASEMLAGLIRGTKHWSLAKMAQLWQWLTPLLSKVFSSITPDSLTYWESFVHYVTKRRDPRRIQPLIDLLLEAELDPTSDAAFNESRKLLLVRQVGVSLQWRFEPLIHRILPTYLDNIQHPYKQVREVIGVNINQLLQLEWIPSFPSVQRLLTANAMTDGVGNVPTTLTERQQQRINVLNSRLDAWLIEMHQNSASILSGSSDYAHASKTVLCWLHEAMNYWNVSGTLPYIVPMLPKIFAMQEINDDQDLQAMATRVLNLTAQVNYPASMLPTLIDEFLEILTTSTNWHIRIRALPVLQIFFFKHLFVMTSAQLLRIMQVVGQLLLDTQIEVRQLASVTLGGLVRCSQRDAIQELLTEFTARIQVKIPKRKRDKVTGRNVEPEGFAEAVLHKHAGVLGISSLINAFPYEVPEWMPVILCQLADCISDPAAEIQATIRKTFSDFRRTHSDTWHEDMLKFNEDQLSVLNDMLISPSYYA